MDKITDRINTQEELDEFLEKLSSEDRETMLKHFEEFPPIFPIRMAFVDKT